MQIFYIYKLNKLHHKKLVYDEKRVDPNFKYNFTISNVGLDHFSSLEKPTFTTAYFRWIILQTLLGTNQVAIFSLDGITMIGILSSIL